MVWAQQISAINIIVKSHSDQADSEEGLDVPSHGGSVCRVSSFVSVSA